MTGQASRAAALAALFVAISSVAAFAQTLGTGADAEISIWRIVLSFLLCAMVAVAAALFMRARTGGGLPAFAFLAAGSRRLRVVESVRLNATTGLSIVECDGREMLFLVAAGESKIVADLGAPANAPVAGQEQPRHA